jgi:hypothetical protein
MINCAECNHQAVVGSRCLHCWISRYARRIGISRYQWFTHNRVKFERMLFGRFYAVQMGVEPGNIQKIINVFYNNHNYSIHRSGTTTYKLKSGEVKRVKTNPKGSGEQKIRKLIAALDAAARKGEHDGSGTTSGNNRIEEN